MFFFLTVPKLFAEETFSVSLISGIQKKLGIREGDTPFSVESNLSHSVENFRRGIL